MSHVPDGLIAMDYIKHIHHNISYIKVVHMSARAGL